MTCDSTRAAWSQGAAVCSQGSHTLSLEAGDPGQAKKTSSMNEADRELDRGVGHLESREIIGLFIILFSPLYEKMQQSKAHNPLFNLNTVNKAHSVVNPPADSSILKAYLVKQHSHDAFELAKHVHTFPFVDPSTTILLAILVKWSSYMLEMRKQRVRNFGEIWNGLLPLQPTDSPLLSNDPAWTAGTTGPLQPAWGCGRADTTLASDLGVFPLLG